MHKFPLSVLVTLCSAALAAQSVPATINYQGRLTANTPSQTPVNATVNMQFSIWDDPAAGTQLWQQSFLGPQPVVVTNGVFNVLLGGGGIPIPASVFTAGSTARYLEINAGGETLTPRQVISATGYANQAENAALAANATLADSATDSAQLGGVAAAGYQLATVQTCAGQQFIKTIGNGTATCATPPPNNLTSPISLGGSLASPTAVLSSSNSSSGPGISASSTGGIGVSVTAGGTDAVLATSTSSSGNGLHGIANGAGAYGVYGESSGGYAGYFAGKVGITTGATGLTVTAGGTDGVLATNTFSSGNGLHGIANSGASAYGVWGESSSGYAGYFSGKVNITGKATSAATVAGDASTTLATKGYVDSGVGVPNPLSLSGSLAGPIISGNNSGGDGVTGIASGASGYGVTGTSNGASGVGGGFSNTAGGTALYSGGLLDVVSGTNSAGNNTALFRANGLIGTKYDSHIHFGTTGDWYIRSALAAGKVIMQDTGGQVTIGTNAPVAGNVLTVQGNVSLGAANFGSATRQQLNLWGAPDGNNTAAYGIGIQTATEYFRASPGGGFAWFQGGTHSDTQNDPGAGGTKLMAVDAGGNLSQPQAAGGAAKAMAYISNTGAITRCYNGGLASGPTSTVPCGMSASVAFTGTYLIDFGFQVNNRFAVATPRQTSKTIDLDYSSTNVIEVDIQTSTTGAPVGAQFTIIVY